MSEHISEQRDEMQRPATDDWNSWHGYWISKKQPWRHMPEIGTERQKFLAERLSIIYDVEHGNYPFKDIKLARADVEWLLATHEGGRGPVDWKDEDQWSRSGLDLRGADLRQVDLSELPLACLRGGLSILDQPLATDEQRDMAAVHLEGANLKSSCLEAADLSGVHLEKASLLKAHLEGASLRATHLMKAILSEAHLEGADLSEANLEGADLSEANLKRAYLGRASLKKVNLARADLERANLIEAHLEQVILSGANLIAASLSKAHLEGVEFSIAARLDKADLSEAYLERANLSGAILEAADLRAAHLRGAFLHVAHLEGADLSAAYLEGVDLSEAHLEKADLSGAANLQHADLHKACLKKANLGETHLEVTNLKEADMREACLQSAHLKGADLTEAHLENAILRAAHLEEANLSKAHLEGADLHGAYLNNAVLKIAYLIGTDLSESFLEGSDLREARLGGASLVKAHLEGANLSKAHLEGTVITNSIVKSTLQQATGDPLSLPATDLREVFLDSATNLEGVILGDKDHGYVYLADLSWGDVNLTKVEWAQVNMLGDEREARQKMDSSGKKKEKSTRLQEYQAAVRANRQLAIALQTQGLNENAARFAYNAQKLQQAVLWMQLRQWPWIQQVESWIQNTRFWGYLLALCQRIQMSRVCKQLAKVGQWIFRFDIQIRKVGAFLFSFFLYLLAGYGYRPGRAVMWYLFAIGGFTMSYTTFGHLPLFPDALVFSLMSFHGRGFFPSLNGEPTLHSPLVEFAATEAVVGLLIEISFIATFTQRFFGK